MPTLFRFMCLLLTLPAVCSTALGANPRNDRCVILVSVDGLAGFYLDDDNAHMPTIRQLAKEGARGKGLVCSFPTVTWPNHTTLVTGATPARHGVIGNNYFDREQGTKVPLIPDPLLDKDQVVKVPTIYDVAYEAGLKTAAIVWPATRNARTLHWTVPDMKGNESWEQFGTRSWLDELRAEGLPVDRYGPWVSESGGGVQRDWLYVRMADHLLRKHTPNLIVIHLVKTDHVQHRYGPRTGDAYWSVSYADDRIRDIVESVNRTALRGKTAIFVCSDHGFFPINKDIHANVQLRQLGLIEAKGSKITRKSALALSQGGGCAVYILDDGRRSEILAQLRTAFAKVEGVQAVIGPEDFARIGQPTPDVDPHGADLWLAAESGYSFVDGHTGNSIVTPRVRPGGTHGFLPDQPDMLGTFVAWGDGIKQGAKLGKVDIVDVAPTMASILGIELPDPDGKPLRAILSD